jgi:NAD/NADP transhydrogenase beta subunit
MRVRSRSEPSTDERGRCQPVARVTRLCTALQMPATGSHRKENLVRTGAASGFERCHDARFLLDNELFYMDKTMMVFGDAKKVVEDIGKAIE